MYIGKQEEADLVVLRFASILHDIGREQEAESKGRICHAERGATLAKVILEKHEISDEIIEEVIHCIETHRSRNNKTPESLEAQILFDADKLDSIGAVGIGRAFYFANEVGAKLHNPDIDIENSKPYSQDDTAFREFKIKLKNVKDQMFTDIGKHLAEERHNFMIDFFNRLNREVKGEI